MARGPFILIALFHLTFGISYEISLFKPDAEFFAEICFVTFSC